jgi:hypothetical protein
MMQRIGSEMEDWEYQIWRRFVPEPILSSGTVIADPELAASDYRSVLTRRSAIARTAPNNTRPANSDPTKLRTTAKLITTADI